MTDQPTLILVCNPAEYAQLQALVQERGWRTVLVQPNRYVNEGEAYLMDPERIRVLRRDD